MAGKSSLQAVLERQARADTTVPVAAIVPSEDKPAPGPAKFHRPSRAGKRLVAAYIDPKVAKQIKMIAAEDDTTVQALIEEALDLLFVKKGRGPLIHPNG